MQARGNQANDSASGILAAHQILDASGVQYWLDSGSLLGLIREGQEIAWDSDIDLGIWESQVPKAFKILKDLRSQGYRVSWRSYRGLTYGFSVEADKKDLLRPIHIHVYFKHGHIAWSPQTVAYQQISRANANIGFALWPRTRKALLYLRDMARTRQTGSTAQKLWKYGFCYPAWGSLVMLRNRLDRQLWSSLWPFSTIYTIYTWIVPIYYFEQLENWPISNATVPVPSRVKEYLSLRYGQWEFPVSDWCYWTDDGCIMALDPSTALDSLY